MAKENMITRARDELFSHINRCGVLQAEFEDQKHWMDETIDYLAERYPDLGDQDLKELNSVGIRFCQPAIPHGRKRFGFEAKEQLVEAGSKAATEAGTEAEGTVVEAEGAGDLAVEAEAEVHAEAQTAE